MSQDSAQPNPTPQAVKQALLYSRRRRRRRLAATPRPRRLDPVRNLEGKHGEVDVDFPRQGARAIVPRVQHRDCDTTNFPTAHALLISTQW